MSHRHGWLLLAALCVLSQIADAKPNIIVIMGDDHGQWAMGQHLARHLSDAPDISANLTPNIDWLARQGVEFRNAFSPAPVCSASRASFFTGKMPSQHGVHDFLSEDPALDANWLDGETLLPQRLQKVGYRTALIGKWHATSDSRKVQRGFDRWLSYDAFKAGWENQYQHRGTVHFSNDGDPLSYTGVQARFLTRQAIEFIDQKSTRPFFVSLNFVEPHFPFDGLPERLVNRYRGLSKRLIRAGDTSDLVDRGPATTVPLDHSEKFAQYLAAVTLIDEQVGHIVDALESRDLLDNTVVIYTSDHGLLMGQYGLYGKTNATTSPNFYEETIRIPLVVAGPKGLVRGGQTRTEMVDLLDLHETIQDWAMTGIDDYEHSGRSMTALISGVRIPNWRQIQFAERGPARMASNGRWKLVRYYNRTGTSKDHWYDLAHPLGERHRSDPPASGTQTRLIQSLESFFNHHETESHSGRLIWQQPPPNRRVCADLGITCPK